MCKVGALWEFHGRAEVDFISSNRLERIIKDFPVAQNWVYAAYMPQCMQVFIIIIILL